LAILEALVIATIIVAGAWAGYHAWQDSLHETAEKHEIDLRTDVFNKKINFQKSEYLPLFSTQIMSK